MPCATTTKLDQVVESTFCPFTLRLDPNFCNLCFPVDGDCALYSPSRTHDIRIPFFAHFYHFVQKVSFLRALLQVAVDCHERFAKEGLAFKI